MTQQINWRTANSLEKPALVDNTSSPNGVYVRRLITETVDNEGITKYSYQEAFMTHEEYSQYSLLCNISESVLGKETSDVYLMYQAKLNTPVEYVNGHFYKPTWAESVYESLIQRGEKFPELLPLKIWDATGLEENTVEMNLEEIKALAIFLAKVQEACYTEYKRAKATL